MWEVIKKMFWIKSRNEKELERLSGIVDQINALEKDIVKYEDTRFLEETKRLKQEIHDYIKHFEEDIEALKRDFQASDDEDERMSFNIEIKDKELKLYRAMKEITETLLPEAFALVREAADRRLGALKIFDIPAEEMQALDPEIQQCFNKYTEQAEKGNTCMGNELSAFLLPEGKGP